MSELLQIVIDTREQAPFSFPEHLVETSRGTIKAGDYGLLNDTHNFAVERKSLPDFVGTISRGWERFLREVERMNVLEFQAKVIIVESDFKDVCFGAQLEPPLYQSNVTPQFIMKRIAMLSMKNVQVLFACDANLASALCYSILKERQETINATKS